MSLSLFLCLTFCKLALFRISATVQRYNDIYVYARQTPKFAIIFRKSIWSWCHISGKRLGGYLCNAWVTSIAYDEQAQYVFIGRSHFTRKKAWGFFYIFQETTAGPSQCATWRRRGWSSLTRWRGTVAVSGLLLGMGQGCHNIISLFSVLKLNRMEPSDVLSGFLIIS